MATSGGADQVTISISVSLDPREDRGKPRRASTPILSMPDAQFNRPVKEDRRCAPRPSCFAPVFVPSLPHEGFSGSPALPLLH